MAVQLPTSNNPTVFPSGSASQANLSAQCRKPLRLQIRSSLGIVERAHAPAARFVFVEYQPGTESQRDLAVQNLCQRLFINISNCLMKEARPHRPVALY